MGPSLLLIPGGGADRGLFDTMLEPLCARVSVMTYDRRGNSREKQSGTGAAGRGVRRFPRGAGSEQPLTRKVTTMETGERSFSTMVQDILGDIQEILRAEVLLAKAEIAQELVKVKVAAVWLVAGALGAIFGLWFALFAAFYALTAVMPEWAAALTLAIALLLVALVTLRLGIGRITRLRPIPERTVETLKENVTWARQSTS